MSEGRIVMLWAGAAFGVEYLALVFIAAMCTGHFLARDMVIFATGMAYLCTVAGVYQGRGSWIAFVLYMATIVLSSLSGWALLL